MVDPQLEITRLINAWQSGDKPSETAVFEAIYRQLHQMGRRFMAAESTDHTLSATGLVGELYLKLNNHGLSFANRHGFFALASRAMRHILVDYARHKKSQKREARLVPFEEDSPFLLGDSVWDDQRLLALDRALTTFQAINPRQAQVAEMKIFSKVDEKTLAEMLNVSLATVQRDWKIARAWLNQHAPQYLGD